MDQCDAIGNGYSTRAHSSAVKPVLKYQSATIEMGHPARSEDRGLRAGWISEMLLETVGPPGPGVEVGSTCSANTSESLRARFESDSALATKAVTTQGTGTVCMCVCVSAPLQCLVARKGTVLTRQAAEAQGRGTILATKAVETHGKGTVTATKSC